MEVEPAAASSTFLAGRTRPQTTYRALGKKHGMRWDGAAAVAVAVACRKSLEFMESDQTFIDCMCARAPTGPSNLIIENEDLDHRKLNITNLSVVA